MIEQCPACDGVDATEVIELRAVPAFCNVLYDTAEEARQAPRGDLRLVMCPTCGLLYNASFDASLLEYSPEYENSLHFSPAFQTYAMDLAARLVDEYDIRNGNVIEVGSGSGDFLSMVCDAGSNTGIGYDPSHDETRAPEDDRISIVVAPYPTTRSVDALFVCSRHVLEHLEAPAGLIADIRGSLVEGANPVIYHEVPDATYMLEEVAIWDLIYEHISYFSDQTMRYIHERAGYDVVKSGRSFGDQYLWIEARPGTSRDVAPDLQRLRDAAASFGTEATAYIDDWRDRTAALVADGPTVVWGAGSKGVQFLNLIEAASDIVAAVDINPRKVGRFVPGTGQPVVSPESLADMGVRNVIVMNPLYVDEITQSLQDLGVDAQVIGA